ncbi:MAG: hypothetical protein NTW86_11200 [Candidatus Sumerlaeota bacterium]|nr:hypothetical protein [Candidatus Sumerlaeota bacterium]
MQYVNLGRTGLKVSRLCISGTFYSMPPTAAARRRDRRDSGS